MRHTLAFLALTGLTNAAMGVDLDLRVMTFNVRYATATDGENHWEKRRAQLFDVIRRHDPDVLGLQEALHGQIGEIIAAVPGYRLVGVGRDDGVVAGEFSAILFRESKFAIEDQGTFWLSDTPGVAGSTSWGNKTTRVCTWARLHDKTASRSFFVFNAHLDHESQRARERGVELIVQRMERRDGVAPAIFTGDFNAGETNPAVLYLTGRAERASSDGSPAPPRSVLIDTYRAVHPDEKDVRTFHGFQGGTPGEKIDYILTPPWARVLEAEIVRDNDAGRYPSDHYPVTARIVLPQPRAS